jgi:hypothetical protein
MGDLNWNGDRILDSYRRQFAVLVGVAGQNLAARMQARIDIQGPPRSNPGDPPHMDTTELHGSVHSTVNSSDPDHPTATAGSSVPQAVYTEMGTSKMAARPWCLSTFKDTRDKIRRDLIGR